MAEHHKSGHCCSHDHEPQEHHHKEGGCCGGHGSHEGHEGHEGHCGCGGKKVAPKDDKHSLMIVDLSNDEGDFELVSGFEDLEHMRSFAEAYRADSMERCRGGIHSTPDEVLQNWQMFGEDVRALDDSIELFSDEYSPVRLSEEKIPEDMRDWRSIDPRNKLKGIAPDDKAAELLKDQKFSKKENY